MVLTPEKQLFSNLTLEENYPISEEELKAMLQGLADQKFGYVLRAKGIVPSVDGGDWHFDYTVSKQSYERYQQKQEKQNRIIVIGSGLNKRALRKYIYSFGENEL